MSTAELKNSLHRMIVETDDPEILGQIAGLFAILKGEDNWWDTITDEERHKIEQGIKDVENDHLIPYPETRKKVNSILNATKK